MVEKKQSQQRRPQCPACQSREVYYRRTDGTFACRRCGHTWAKE